MAIHARGRRTARLVRGTRTAQTVKAITKHLVAGANAVVPPTLAEVDAFPVPEMLVERISMLHAVPREYAAGLLREAKRMLFLAIVSGEAVAPSDRVDWAWHEMLMFTRLYREFSTFIGGFIHHDPNPMSDGGFREETWEEIQRALGKPREESETYTKTKANYEKHFGERPGPLFWP